MTDKTFSSSKSSSSSLALKAETTKSVIYVSLSLSLSLFPCVVDAKTKSTLTKAHKVSRFFYCVACEGRTTWTPKKRKNTTKAERFERFSHRLSQEIQEKRQRVQRKKQNKKFLSLFLSRALQSFVVRCVWEIRILFN